MSDVFSDPQVLHRNMLVEIEHPTIGSIKTSGNPIKTGQDEIFSPPPLLGQHTQEILKNICGYSVAEIKSLEAVEAI